MNSSNDMAEMAPLTLSLGPSSSGRPLEVASGPADLFLR